MAFNLPDAKHSVTLFGVSVGLVSAVTLGFFYYLQCTTFSLTIDIVVFLSLATVALLFCIYRSIGIGVRNAALLSFSLWILAIALLRFTTPHRICESLFIEASSMRLLDQSLWKSTHGQILFSWHGEENVFAKPICLDSESRPLTAQDMERLMSQTLGRTCSVAFRPGYWDFAFRPTSISVSIVDNAGR